MSVSGMQAEQGSDDGMLAIVPANNARADLPSNSDMSPKLRPRFGGVAWCQLLFRYRCLGWRGATALFPTYREVAVGVERHEAYLHVQREEVGIE